MSNLYTLSAEYQKILDKDEYSLEDIQSLDELTISLEDKAIAIASYILNEQAQLNAISEAILNMKERSFKIENKIENLTEYIRLNLEKCHIEEVSKCPYFLIKIKTNPPSIFVEDESKIPTEYFKSKTTLSLDKVLIKKKLEEGIAITGASIIQRTRLEIK